MPVRFYLYPMPNKKGECPIRVSVSIGSTRFMTGIGYNCTVEAWEEGKGVKAKYTNSKGVTSKMINARMTSIQAHFMAYELKKEFKQAIIGTHAGRRTFICFALSQGIAPQVVMKWTGHSDYKAMKPYIDIAEKTKAEAMNIFEKGLKKIIKLRKSYNISGVNSANLLRFKEFVYICTEQKIDTMITRAIEDRINNALAKKKAVTIMGPRQVGKSTLADAIIPKDAKVLEINGDNTDVQTMFANVDEAKMKILIGNNNFLFVDEAQKIENVGNMLKIVAEKFKDVKIIVTGSSAFKLAEAVNESLTGRKREFKLYPLSFKEMADDTSILEESRMIDHRLIYGYYPEVVTSPGDEKEVLKELIDSYLYKDVMEENNIAKPDKLVKLVQALAFQIGSTVSANELAGLVGIDAKTVERYIEILEKSYIIFTLPSYAKNQRNELKFARKLYFWDMGIRNGVIGNMAPVSLRSPEELGHMWENFVIAERIKRNEYAGRTFVQHYFWRTQQKKEVDLIEIEDGVMTGYEIKRKEGKRVGAPASFTAAYPDAHFECITPTDLMGFLM